MGWRRGRRNVAAAGSAIKRGVRAVSEGGDVGGAKRRDWGAYYARVAGRPPRPTLLLAMQALGPGGGRLAVDLGAGGGRDTAALLAGGWRVRAIDASADAATALRANPDIPADAPLDIVCARFEDADWPTAGLVNASFALPLCPAARFPALWRRIVGSLVSGGCFAGQLYGERDSWAGDPTNTHLTRAEVNALLAGMDVLLLDEEESDGATPRGRPKHWHIFHIVARRPA